MRSFIIFDFATNTFESVQLPKEYITTPSFASGIRHIDTYHHTDLTRGIGILAEPEGYFIYYNPNGTNINEPSITSHFTISPNPVSSVAVANFVLLHPCSLTLEVTDILGNILFSTTTFYDAGEHSVPLDIEGLAIGSYICRMLVNGKPVGSVGFVVGR